MTSNLACVGLLQPADDDFEAFLDAVGASAAQFGRGRGLELRRWEDPSGARLAFGMQGERALWCLPSFASEPTTRLATVERASDDVAIADVVDDEGETLTGLTMELEQIRLLPDRGIRSAFAGVTFFGTKVSVHADAEAFHRSDESIFDPDEPEPADWADDDVGWPLRMDSESFFSYGIFAEPVSDADAGARFAGVVLDAERRSVALTQLSFIVARVCVVGIDATVCLSGAEFANVPESGQILAGEVFVVGSIPALEEPTPKRRWWRPHR